MKKMYFNNSYLKMGSQKTAYWGYVQRNCILLLSSCSYLSILTCTTSDFVKQPENGIADFFHTLFFLEPPFFQVHD